MIGLFARLKLRLLWNSVRHGQGLGLILFTVLSAILSASATLSASRLAVADLDLTLPIAALVLVLASLLSPLLFGSTDETVDTTRLALYPLDTRRLAVGMGTAALVGPGPLAVFVPVAAVATRAPSIGGLIVGLAAAFTLVVLVAILPKLVMTVFGALLRRRRSRDIATVASSLVVAVVAIGGQAAVALGGGIDRRHLEVVAAGARVVPVAWPADALVRVLDGQIVVPLGLVAASWILLTYLTLKWAAVLERALADVDEGGTASDLGGHLLGRGAERPHAIRPILAKERRYLRRHPRYRVQVISQAMVVMIGGVPFLSAVLDKRPEAVLLGCVPGLTAGLTGANLLGPDGRALWAEAVALPSLRPLLRGRSLVFAAIGIAGSVTVTLAAAAYTGGWAYTIPAIAAGFAMSVTGAGVGTITSTLAVVPYPEESNPNPFASGLGGGGCVTGLISFTGVLIGLVVAVPILFGIAQGIDGDRWLLVGITLLSPPYGLAVWFLTTSVAGRRVDRALPRILTELARA